MNKKSIISHVIGEYIKIVGSARSYNTGRTYRNAMNNFCVMLNDNSIDPDITPITNLPENAILWFISSLKDYAPTTERLYLTAVVGFYEYLAAERLYEINLPRLRLLIRQRARKPGQRLPQFPHNDIARIIQYANNIALSTSEDPLPRFRNLRDRAFLLTLADTGLRVHEACALRRGDIDWYEGKALVIGKGDQQAVIRFSTRSLVALKDYLAARASLDGDSGRPLPPFPSLRGMIGELVEKLNQLQQLQVEIL